MLWFSMRCRVGYHHSLGAEDPALELMVDGVTIDCQGQFSALGTVSWLLVGWSPSMRHCLSENGGYSTWPPWPHAA